MCRYLNLDFWDKSCDFGGIDLDIVKCDKQKFIQFFKISQNVKIQYIYQKNTYYANHSLLLLCSNIMKIVFYSVAVQKFAFSTVN